jgi:hypothetical protein
MRCPHCHNVARCVWVGYGKDWVLCRHCQRRVRWLEVETKYLLRDENVLGEGSHTEAAYH